MIPSKPLTSLGLVAQFSRPTATLAKTWACMNTRSPRPSSWVRRRKPCKAHDQTRPEQERHLRAQLEFAGQDFVSSSQGERAEIFFENGVWSFQTTAVPDRTFTSRILLKWAKNADGTQGPKHVWLSEDTPTLMLWLADWTQLH